MDYRDSAGVRRWRTFSTKREADIFRDEASRESRQPTWPLVDVDITVAEYAERWLGQLAATAKLRTRETYAYIFRVHVNPALGGVKVRQLHRARVRQFLVEKLAPTGKTREPLARGTVRLILGALRAMLAGAVEDGVLVANPCDRLGRQLKLHDAKAGADEVKAFTREQAGAFLRAAAAAPRLKRYYPPFLLMARSGLRIGEALGLQWDDVNIDAREIRVARTLGRRGEVGTPKGGRARTVAMSRQLCEELLRLRAGRKDGCPWLFPSRSGKPMQPEVVQKAMKRVLKAAGLSPHFTPHSFRHTFGSQLLADGESPQWVQQELGHASIVMTTSTYGRWLPKRPLGRGVDALDDGGGSRTVAAAVDGPNGAAQAAGNAGGSSVACFSNS